ncbi:MAG: hypothetical protein ABR597_04655 [Bacteroidales bacterium]
MLQKFLQRIAIEFPFLSKINQPNFPFDSHHRNLAKKYEDIDLYLEFYDSVRKKLNNFTEKTINFQNNLKFGSKTKSVKRKLLKPLADHQSEGLLKTEILLYKKSYRGFSAMTEFHFYENKLFYIECNLGNLSNRERTELLDEIKGFYDVKFNATENLKITNTHDYIMSIENLSEFKIIYADTGNDFFKELENIEIFYNKRESSGQVLLNSTSFHGNEEENIEKIKGTL